MYTMSLLRGLGQAETRSAVLQDAITHVLKLERLTVFPTGAWTIAQVSFDRLVALILQRANEMLSREEYPLFSIGEVGAALVTRGYKAGALPRATTPDTVKLDPVEEYMLQIQPITDTREAWRAYKEPDQERPIALYPTVAPIVTQIGPPAEAFIASQNTILPERIRLPGGITLPIIVPPSPSFPEIPLLPPLAEGKSSTTWLWIAGLLALYLLGRTDKPHRSGRRKKRRTTSVAGLSGLGGDIANTLLWQEVESEKTGGLLWRALKQGAACSTGPCKPPTHKFQTRVCVKKKQVPNASGHFLKKSLSRCSKYQRVCATSCIPESMTKPDAAPGHGLNVNLMLRDVSKQLAQDKNDDEEIAGKALGREIMDRGGLRQYKGGQLREEFSVIPLFMRRKGGLPLDEMAGEMGYQHESEFLAAIRQAYPGTKKTKRSYTAADFKLEAERMVWDAIEAGQVSGLGQAQNLFPGLRREMVLTSEDLSTTDDPLEMHLEHKGWKLSRVRELQDSIAEKMVPDLFTGKRKKLSPGEKELQADIQSFFTGKQEYRESVQAKHAKSGMLLGALSTAKIAQGVRKAVAEDASRKAHGDTSLRAFFITPDLDIVPWKQWRSLKPDVGNTSVHSHSAENWNYLVQLTGKLEPPERFSRKDVEIFRDHLRTGRVDTDVLINGDGRMIVVKCDPDKSNLRTRSSVMSSLKLPRAWSTKGQYAGMTYYDATRKRQKDFLERAGCQWIDTRWRPDDANEPMLFKTMPRSQEEAIETYMRDPIVEHTRRQSRQPGVKGKKDLTRAFWVHIDPLLYPVEPAQQELFVQRRRKYDSPKGEQYTIEPGWAHKPPVQMRLLGS